MCSLLIRHLYQPDSRIKRYKRLYSPLSSTRDWTSQFSSFAQIESHTTWFFSNYFSEFYRLPFFKTSLPFFSMFIFTCEFSLTTSLTSVWIYSSFIVEHQKRISFFIYLVFTVWFTRTQMNILIWFIIWI